MELCDAVNQLAALAQETRLEIFRLLARQNQSGLAAGDIAESLQTPANTISFHLKELVTAGMIQSQRDGRHVFYSIKAQGLRDLLAYLTEDCCGGNPEMCHPIN
ncbi:ArsR/SmtB family transcription factor [Rubritalea marina]|uniref:ArsR/SmtB family transcription factor n=1 Tax=Rubritalea marina TaxID=361055 RepID=UPI00036EF0EC|nr:metalloregulator ArsR/SmtB family transcription factor [Rubritalea marina]